MGNVDIRPDLMSEGGGLVDDFDGEIRDMLFVMTDYDGAMAEAVPVCQVVFDVDGEESIQLYSVGGSGDFTPDETGHGLNKLKSKSKVVGTTKFGLLLDSIVEAGFPLNKMEPRDITPIIGLKGHFLRKAVEYKGLKKKNDRDNTVLLCTKIIQLPWDDKKSSAKKEKGKKADDTELADTVAEVIQGIVIEEGGEIAKKSLLSALFKHDDIKALGDDKKEALKIAADDTFLKSRDEWGYEDGILKMA